MAGDGLEISNEIRRHEWETRHGQSGVSIRIIESIQMYKTQRASRADVLESITGPSDRSEGE